MRICLFAGVMMVGCLAPPATIDGGDTSGAHADAGEFDAGIDGGSSLPVGAEGFCKSQWAGKTGILVLAVTPSGGSSLYAIYPDAPWDEHVADFVYNGHSLSLADFTLAGTTYYATNGVAWWRLPGASVPRGTYELGTPVPFGPNGTPPTASYVSSNPWVGRSGTSLFRLSVTDNVDWAPNGSVLGAGTSCTNARDFLSGRGGTPTFSYLATCGNDPNAIVTVNVSQDTNGNWVGSSSIGTLPYAIAQPVVAISDTTLLTATKIYSAGVYVRDLKVCLNEGALSSPIAGLRAVVQ